MTSAGWPRQLRETIMPRRNAKPPYEIFRNAPPSASTPAGSTSPTKAAPRSGGRGRRVIGVPESATLRDAGRSSWAWLIGQSQYVNTSAQEAWGALRKLWSQRAAQRADRRDAAAAKHVKVAESAAGAWWITSGKPVVLRMTRGLVVLGIAGVVGLVLLAYFVGRSDRAEIGFADTWPPTNRLAIGDPAAEATEATEATETPLLDVPGGSDTTSGVVVPQPRQTPPPASDPRIVGHNYLIYTLTDLGTARELAAFLREQGPRVMILPTGLSVSTAPGPAAGGVETEVAAEVENDQNVPLYWVVDITRGFSTAEYRRGEHHAFLAERLGLGRAWKRHNGGRGSALESMTFYKRQPPRPETAPDP
jgi:hypothetical protein